MMEWQPIETAPKDGAEILITDGQTVAVVSWNEYAAELYDGIGWTDMGEMGWGGMVGAEPTHWMPLPAPPKSLQR